MGARYHADPPGAKAEAEGPATSAPGVGAVGEGPCSQLSSVTPHVLAVAPLRGHSATGGHTFGVLEKVDPPNTLQQE